MEKYIDRKWNNNSSRYSVEQMLAAMPKAITRCVRAKASVEKREVTKADCQLLYREPNGVINYQGVQLALLALDKLKDSFVTNADRISAFGELKGHLTQARKALGIEASGLVVNAIKPSSQVVHSKPALASFSAQMSDIVTRACLTPAGKPQQRRQIAQPTTFTPAYGNLIDEFIEVAKKSDMIARPQMILAPGFREQLLRFAETPDGLELMELATHLVAGGQEAFLRAGANTDAAKPMDLQRGSVENDLRPLPNYRALGITRAAGDATPDEIKYFAGQTRNDNTPVGVADFFSVGSLLANNDLIPKFLAYIPPVELGRLGVMLQQRAKKSDQDHSRKVLSGNFTIVNPMLGVDEDCKLHVDHPMLGKQKYTGLTARLLYPIQEFDAGQRAAVENVRRGRLQNLSIAFGYGSIGCGLCGDMTIKKVIEDGANVIALQVDPSANPELFRDRTEDEGFYRLPCTLRSPAETEGGFIYKTISAVNANANGMVQINPLPKASFKISDGTVFTPNMDSFFSYYFGGLLTYCRLHGMNGTYMRDGRRAIGMFNEMRHFINTAHVDAGAIVDARAVLDPGSVN